MSQFTSALSGQAADVGARLDAARSARVREMRNAALARVRELDLPHPKQEQWKYTDVSALKTLDFVVPLDPQRDAVLDHEVCSGAVAANQVVFIDGHFSAADSTLVDGEDVLRVERISERLDRDDPEVLGALSGSRAGDNVFSFINTTFLQDGALITVAAGSSPQALQVVFVDTGSGQRLICPRLIVRAGAGSRCQIVESHVSIAASGALICPVTDIEAARGSTVDHYRLQFDDSAHHIASVLINCLADASVTNCSIALGGNLSRLDVTADLSEPGGEVSLNGLFIASPGQHIDHHTRINHLAPHTVSFENYKGIAAARGRGVFNGKIYVAEGAQKISATQSSKNLLLADGAEIDTKPELEIYADDVQCAHGATVGQLSLDEMFYLRSRGITSDEARRMLTQAFVGDIVASIANETLRNLVTDKVSAKFRK